MAGGPFYDNPASGPRIRAVLGHKENPLRLSDRFRQRVTEELGFATKIPADAWWSTDYHIDWLAGALAVFMKGETAPGIYSNERRLVEGNQEDIDLVIATQHHLILIEAKAYRSFGNAQIASKLERLNLLHDFYQELAAKADRVVCFHPLLLSPKRPKLDVPWPTWACKDSKVPSEVAWIDLPLGDATPAILEVTRCDELGNRTAAGSSWRYRNTNPR